MTAATGPVPRAACHAAGGRAPADAGGRGQRVVVLLHPQVQTGGLRAATVAPLAWLLADASQRLATTPGRRRAWVASVASGGLLALAVVGWLTLHQDHLLRGLGQRLRAEHQADEPVYMLEEYFYDVPFYAHLRAPVRAGGRLGNARREAARQLAQGNCRCRRVRHPCRAAPAAAARGTAARAVRSARELGDGRAVPGTATPSWRRPRRCATARGQCCGACAAQLTARAQKRPRRSAVVSEPGHTDEHDRQQNVRSAAQCSSSA